MGVTLGKATAQLSLWWRGSGRASVCPAAASIVGVVSVSAYLYLTPVVTVVASAIVLAEPLTWQIVLGVALTVTGLVLSER